MDLEKDLFGLSAADSKGGAQVGIIMGSDSDLPTMKAAAEVLEAFGVSYEISIVSAHRYGHYFSLYIFSIFVAVLLVSCCDDVVIKCKKFWELSTSV